MQGENVWCDSIVSVRNMHRSLRRTLKPRLVQIDALHTLGYTMLVFDNPRDAIKAYRQHHENVQVILWSHDFANGGACTHDSTCVYEDAGSLLPPPPPNSTHVNIPLWYVA